MLGFLGYLSELLYFLQSFFKTIPIFVDFLFLGFLFGSIKRESLHYVLDEAKTLNLTKISLFVLV